MSEQNDDAAAPGDTEAASEKADKQRKRRVELAGAIIIGIAAVLTAVATYQGSQVDGTVQEKSTEAVGLTLDANDAYNDANSFRAEERDWFFGYVTALGNDQEFTADLLLRAMPLEVTELTSEWFDRNVDRIDNPDELIDDPFFEGAFSYETFESLPSVISLQLGNERYIEAQCALFDSQVAEVRGDNYGLSTVFLAIALVVGGIAALLNRKAAQIIVLVTASVSLVVGAGVLVLAADQVDARAETAKELFAFDENDEPLTPDESLALADDLCPQESDTSAASADTEE